MVIWGSDRAKFGTPETAYQDKDIWVTGEIKEYQNAPEIVATDPKQIKLEARASEKSSPANLRDRKPS